MRLLVMALVLASALTACGQAISPHEAQAPQGSGYAVADRGGMAPADQPAPAPPPTTAGEEVATDGTRADDQRQTTTISPGSAQTLYLAYSYQMGLEIPSARLASVMDAHARACQTAGPRLCQLVAANRSGDPDSSMNGTINVRGEPNWLRTFMAGVSAQVSAAGGRVLSQATNTEDLTRSIVDT